jgi:hypothetical protein
MPKNNPWNERVNLETSTAGFFPADQEGQQGRNAPFDNQRGIA